MDISVIFTLYIHQALYQTLWILIAIVRRPHLCQQKLSRRSCDSRPWWSLNDLDTQSKRVEGVIKVITPFQRRVLATLFFNSEVSSVDLFLISNLISGEKKITGNVRHVPCSVLKNFFHHLHVYLFQSTGSHSYPTIQMPPNQYGTLTSAQASSTLNVISPARFVQPIFMLIHAT